MSDWYSYPGTPYAGVEKFPVLKVGRFVRRLILAPKEESDFSKRPESRVVPIDLSHPSPFSSFSLPIGPFTDPPVS